MTRPRQRPAELGALRQWWHELAAGIRKPTTFDVLHLAACREAEANDLARLGCPVAAAQARQDAARVIVAAAGAKRSERAA